MQAQTPANPGEKATTPRYDTIVIRGAKGQAVPRELDGGEVVAWSRGHELAAMDALEEFVDDLAAGNCDVPEHVTSRAVEALALMRRRRELGWDADEAVAEGDSSNSDPDQPCLECNGRGSVTIDNCDGVAVRVCNTCYPDL